MDRSPWKSGLSGFDKDALRTFAGTATAAAITFFSLPVLSRLFSVSDFGYLQVLVSIVAVVGPIAAGRYDVAIVLARSDEERRGVVALALAVALVSLGVTGFVLGVAAEPLGSLLQAPFLVEATPLLLAGIAMSVLGLIGQQILVARSKFSGLAKVSTLQAALAAALAVAVGLTRATPQGLFASRMIPNLLFAVAGFWTEPLRLDSGTLRQARVMARVHRKLPIYDTLSVLSNTVAVHLPVFFFAHFFAPQDVGFYMMAGRLLDTPLTLVTGSLSRVYLQEGARRFERSAAELRALYLQLQRRLLLAGAVLVPVAWLVAPELARLFLGNEWAPVGLFVQILLFWKLFEFLNVPTSYSLIILGRPEVALGLRVLSLLVRVVAMTAFAHDAIQMLVALSVSAGLYYAAYNAVVYVLLTRSARNP